MEGRSILYIERHMHNETLVQTLPFCITPFPNTLFERHLYNDHLKKQRYTIYLISMACFNLLFLIYDENNDEVYHHIDVKTM